MLLTGTATEGKELLGLRARLQEAISKPLITAERNALQRQSLVGGPDVLPLKPEETLNPTGKYKDIAAKTNPKNKIKIL
jgi:hypothetical protein